MYLLFLAQYPKINISQLSDLSLQSLLVSENSQFIPRFFSHSTEQISGLIYSIFRKNILSSPFTVRIHGRSHLKANQYPNQIFY